MGGFLQVSNRPRLEGVGMEHSMERQETASGTSPESTETQLEKPKIHTTESGSQYVRLIDVVRSKAGWAEIQRLKEADLVRPPSASNGSNSTHSNENR